MTRRRSPAGSAVIDSSCLISLLHLDQSLPNLNLIRALALRYTKIYIPHYVAREIGQKHRARYNLRQLIRRYTFLSRCSVGEDLLVQLLCDRRLNLTASIERGEAEVIVQARERAISSVLMDDQAGRRLAEAHSLQPIGVLGLLKEFKRAGIIREIRPLVEKLQTDIGFRVAPGLLRQVLLDSGEDSPD